MWRPKNYGDIQAILGVAETASLDFKREIGRPADVAKVIAAMSVEGGVVAYGIDEDTTTLTAAALTPVVLHQAPERIAQIANSNIEPPPAVVIEVIHDPTNSAEGFVIVEVPPSPLAPHMWDTKYPARSGPTTRYLSEREVERLYQQRRGVRAHVQLRAPFDDFNFHSTSDEKVRARTIWLQLSVEPVGEYVHPHGARVAPSLDDAQARAAVAHRDLVSQDFWSRLLGLAESGWTPQGSVGFEAGSGITTIETLDEYTVVASSVYAHGGPMNIEVRVGLSNDNTFAHEQIWISEAIAAILLAGNLFSEIPGVTFVNLDVRLWGIRGRTNSIDPRFAVLPKPEIVDGVFEASATVLVREMLERPQDIVQALFDRLLISFAAESTVDALLKPTS